MMKTLFTTKGKEARSRLFAESHLERLNNYHGEKKANFILKVEMAYWESRKELNLQPLYDVLIGDLNRSAKWYAKKFKQYGIPEGEFLNEYLEELFRHVQTVSPHPSYYFYESFKPLLKYRSIDVARRYTSNQKQFERSMKSLEAIQEKKKKDTIIDTSMNVELQVMVKEDMLNNEMLTEQERQLLKVMHMYPNLKKNEVCEAIGIEPYQYSRIIKKIAGKLTDI
ncbi:hypothetical protein [Arthrobacter sp. NPDC057013]|uniref:hypothetical protein n=1 Tax=Arthrobacter sp. NPDC057013 TaxID=3345999 RepID=UPI00362A75A2